jgi:alpha-tubulin suppressor-like RCC1 family protein
MNRLTPTPIVSLNGVVQIAAGGSHSLALMMPINNSSKVFSWGSNIVRVTYFLSF